MSVFRKRLVEEADLVDRNTEVLSNDVRRPRLPALAGIRIFAAVTAILGGQGSRGRRAAKGRRREEMSA